MSSLRDLNRIYICPTSALIFLSDLDNIHKTGDSRKDSYINKEGDFYTSFFARKMFTQTEREQGIKA